MRPFGLLLLLFALLAAKPLTAEERPNAMRLFPGRAVFFIRSPAAADFLGRIEGSNFFQDPEVRPFLDALFGKVDSAFREGEAGETTGGGLGDLLELFQGEVAFGVVPRQNEGPGVLFLADTVGATARAESDAVLLADAVERADRLIESLKAKAVAEDDAVALELIGSTEVVVFRGGDDVKEVGGIFQREGVLLFSNDKMLLESAILKWDEALGVPLPVTADADEAEASDKEQDDKKRADRLRRRYAEPLANNEAFTESLRECVEERIGGGDAAPPNVAVFVDPVGIFRAIAQRNTGMRVALATLPILGLDGIEGAAAAMWVDYGDWDTLLRAHLLLDNPRAGVLKMARLAPTDPTPGDAIPADVASYTCGAADFAATLDGAGQLYDRIRGEGEFAKLVEGSVTKKLGIAPSELIERITGRVTSVQAYGETEEGQAVRVSPPRAILIDITDVEWINTSLRGVLERTGLQGKWDTHGGVEYVRFLDLGKPEGVEESREDRRRRRQLEASGVMTCAAIVEDQLVLAQTTALLRKLIDTKAGLHDRLAKHLPFRLTASRAKRLGANTIGGEEGRLLTYEDPGAQFRQWHAAGTSEESRAELDRLAERASPMRWLRDAIDDGGIPPLEAMMRHATPSGGALFDTPRGFRYVAFAFKLEDE